MGEFCSILQYILLQIITEVSHRAAVIFQFSATYLSLAIKTIGSTKTSVLLLRVLC